MDGIEFVAQTSSGTALFSYILAVCAVVCLIGTVIYSIKSGERFVLIVGLIVTIFFAMSAPIPTLNASLAESLSQKEELKSNLNDYYGVEIVDTDPGKMFSTRMGRSESTPAWLKDGRECSIYGNLDRYTLFCKQPGSDEKVALTPASE